MIMYNNHMTWSRWYPAVRRADMSPQQSCCRVLLVFHVSAPMPHSLLRTQLSLDLFIDCFPEPVPPLT